ncbi:MAG TPA: M23 family metallopeptidase [Candidatus Sumerlaeota bacterium]|nr:MAG: Murein DD-endopeptidase MepM [candidate division BRC1 bacterium ADurb.BinA292]HOR26520.1 M23 family metallopeptidase [Candidatus Sumerlaeota bacterium]HPK03170.1 M23 family metallopeptidase [Candidatus Sumerlaeota bacterium]
MKKTALSVMLWSALMPVLLLLAQPQWVSATIESTVNTAPPQTAPAVVQNEGETLRRALLARLEFEELGLHLVGIAVFEGRPSCFIKHPGSSEQMAYTVGDVIGGYTVEAIDDDSVTFARDGLRMWLMLGETSDGRHADQALAEAEALEAEAHDEELDGHSAASLAADAEAFAEVQAAAAAPVEERIDIALDASRLGLEDGMTALRPAIIRKVENKTPPDDLKNKTQRFKTAKLIEDGDVARPASSHSSAVASAMFQMPMKGRLTSSFGYRRHPIGGQGRMHKGLDIAAPHGTTVRAAADGVVTKARYSSSYGYHVILRHGNGYETLYGHLSKRLVKEGDRVKQGDPIGKEGDTGYSTGPHLHFEIRHNGKALNPLAYVKP